MKWRTLMGVAAVVFLFPGVSASQGGRFTANGNGTVTDNETGLVWQQQDDGLSRNWEAALAYCQDLDLGGSTKWRLPDVKELSSIVDDSRFNPAIDTAAFPGTMCDWYYSSSTDAYYTSWAWFVYFCDGYVGRTPKTSTYYVRCVR